MAKQDIQMKNVLYADSVAYNIGYSDGRSDSALEILEWLSDNSINYIDSSGITNWRQIYRDLRKNIMNGQETIS